jgi:hypothetical protein
VNAKLLPQPKYLLTFLPEAHESPDGMPAFDDVLIEWSPEGWLLTSDMHEVMVPHEGVGLLVQALRSREDDSFFDGWDASHFDEPWSLGSEISTGRVADPAPADPNALAPGHNPDKLTNAQVGVSEGWRLLGEEEVDTETRSYRGTEWWVGNHWNSNTDAWFANVGGFATLRTKNPPGFYRIEGGVK